MQLTDHLRALRRHWLLVALITVVGFACAVGASMLTTPKYSAKSVVYFSMPSGTSGVDLQAGSSYAQSEVESYAQLATTHVVLQPVIDQKKLATSTSALAGSLQVSVVQGTVMISVVATDPSPAKAALLSNAVAESLSTKVTALSPRTASDTASVSAHVVTKAVTPKVPSSPHTKRNALAGLLGGLLIGIVVAILRDLTDTRVRVADDVKELTKAPVLGQVGSRFSVAEVMLGNVYSPEMEAIRRVRTNLGFLGIEQRPLAVAITSALPGEGKSTIAVSLAHALGESGQSVLLVDADLRRPAVGRLTDLDDSVGLTTLLIGAAEFDDAVQTWATTGVDVLTSGAIPPNPGELLESQAMERLMKEARARYDVIVIDTAPLVPVADTVALSPLISGYVMVARSGVVRSGDFTEAVSTLANVDGRLYGVVMNGVSKRQTPSYTYRADDDRGSATPPSTPPRRGGRHGHRLEVNRAQRSLPGVKGIRTISDHTAARVVD